MNRTPIKIASILVMIPSLGWTQDGCERPWPVVLPEVAETREQVLELQAQVKVYLEQANAYLACNESAQAALGSDDFEASQTQQNLVNLYNNTVDEMHQVGDRFNALVRDIKSREPDT